MSNETEYWGPKFKVERTDGTPVDPDEPVFVIRAQDALAVKVVEFYIELAEDIVGGSMLEDLESHIDAIRQWRLDHPERVKIPD